MSRCINSRAVRSALTMLLAVLPTVSSAPAGEFDSLFGNCFPDSRVFSGPDYGPACGEIGCGEIGCGDSPGCGESPDWLGLGGCCEDNGVTFRGSVTQYYQGVVDGGIRDAWQYAGHGFYEVNFDLGKMKIHDGLSVRMVAENRWGEFLARDAGVALPPAVDAATPVSDSTEVFLTDLLFTQVLTENVAVFAGKMDLFDGDRNPFASGRGRTSFMNTSLVFPTNAVPIFPYAALATGAIFSMDGTPFASLIVMNPTDTTTTSGLSDLFADGVLLMGSVTLPCSVNDQLGFHTLTAAWSSKEFTALGQDPRIITGQVPIQPTKGAWYFGWSGTQYIRQFDPKNDPLKGWGFFGRFGVSDAEVAPIRYYANAGIGGNSPVRGRQDDRFGIGWFYGGYSSSLGPLITTVANLGSNTQGAEVFYNVAVNDHLFITPDIQVIQPGSQSIDTTVVAGVRGEITF